MGSGQGPVATGDIIAELPGIAAALTEGSFAIDARTMPLAEVVQAKAIAGSTTDRIVVVPA